MRRKKNRLLLGGIKCLKNILFLFWTRDIPLIKISYIFTKKKSKVKIKVKLFFLFWVTFPSFLSFLNLIGQNNVEKKWRFFFFRWQKTFPDEKMSLIYFYPRTIFNGASFSGTKISDLAILFNFCWNKSR